MAPTINTLIGKRFEDILKRLYPELIYIGDDTDRIPDFEHRQFFAEAKVFFDKSSYAAHLKYHQVEGFEKFSRERKKPVIYIIGIHNFADSTNRLSGLDTCERKEILAKEMNVSKLYIVDRRTIDSVWHRRNGIGGKKLIQDCTLREGHLNQIIENEEITVHGKKYHARSYYGVPRWSYSFSPLKYNAATGLSIGHIMPSSQLDIVDFFHK